MYSLENQDKNFSERESLLLIQQMITAAKQAIQEDGFLYLLWGWLVLAASLSNFILLRTVGTEISYLPWPVLMITGAIVSVLHGRRQQKKEKVTTYVDEFMKYLWSAFGVALLFVLLYMIRIGPEAAYPLILVIYGIGTFVSGGALRFRPLIWGGISCWVLAIIAVFVSFEYQLLLLALSVLLSYIIPGYILKANYKRNGI